MPFDAIIYQAWAEKFSMFLPEQRHYSQFRAFLYANQCGIKRC